MWPELNFHPSARKHYERDRLSDEHVLHAYMNASLSYPLDANDNPAKWLVLGFDPSSRLLEMIVMLFDEERALIIHAMKARPHYAQKLTTYYS